MRNSHDSGREGHSGIGEELLRVRKACGPRSVSGRLLFERQLQYMPCKAIAVARYNAGTCFILLPCATLRLRFSTSGSAPTLRKTSYASGIGKVSSISPCLTRMRLYEGTADASALDESFIA